MKRSSEAPAPYIKAGPAVHWPIKSFPQSQVPPTKSKDGFSIRPEDFRLKSSRTLKVSGAVYRVRWTFLLGIVFDLSTSCK